MARACVTLTFLCFALGLIPHATAPAADKKEAIDKAVEKDDVKKSIDRGVAYLKKSQQKDGSWGPPYGTRAMRVTNVYIGTTALVGLALLEAGVPAKDPAIQKATDFVRDAVPDLTFTHSLGSCILFLDRLGDPKDLEAIRVMTARLMAGQANDGGWGYECPRVSADVVARWVKPEQFLLGIKKVRDLELTIPAPTPGKLVPGQGLHVRGVTENSCSEFAVQGLWIGRRHEVPVQLSLNKFEIYCRTSQYPDGSFPYSKHVKSPAGSGGVVAGTPSMTCAGLLGIVYCNSAANEQALLKYAQSKAGTKPEFGKGLRDPAKDQTLTKALIALEASMRLSEAGAKGPPGTLWGPSTKYTYMAFWSIERVGMAYDLDRIGKLDWYNWGANLLLKYQDKDGSWGGGTAAGPVGADLDTAFALLFLRRSNLTPDLTTLSTRGTLPSVTAPSVSADK